MHPNALLRMLWDAFMLLLILYVAVVEPFRIAFEFNERGVVNDVRVPGRLSAAAPASSVSRDFWRDPWTQLEGCELKVPSPPPSPLFPSPRFFAPRPCPPQTARGLDFFDFAIDGYFSIDMALNFVTAYFDDAGVLITSFRKIFNMYFFFWFPVDLASTIPFDTIIEAVTAGAIERSSAEVIASGTGSSGTEGVAQQLKARLYAYSTNLPSCPQLTLLKRGAALTLILFFCCPPMHGM